MGFFVEPFEKPKSEPKAGRDYTPSQNEGYQPLVNLHHNHSNLEGNYDPRSHLDEVNRDDSSVVQGQRERRKALAITLFLFVCVILLVGLYLISVAHT